jgi:hypothetical protein
VIVDPPIAWAIAPVLRSIGAADSVSSPLLGKAPLPLTISAARPLQSAPGAATPIQVGNLSLAEKPRPDVIVMVYLRIILTSLIALAVASAPIAAMAVSGGGVRAADAAVTHHCHGKAAQSTAGDADDAALPHHNQDKTSQQTDKGSCPGCDGKGQVNCIGDGGKCCKLTGMAAVLPLVIGPAETADPATSMPTLVGWRMRPSPPPPRT